MMDSLPAVTEAEPLLEIQNASIGQTSSSLLSYQSQVTANSSGQSLIEIAKSRAEI